MPSAPPLPPSPCTTMTMGTVEHRHFAQVEGDRLGDAALLRFDAGIRGGRIDEADDGAVELLGQLHRAQRLAIPLRARVAEVPIDLLLGIAALLVAHDQQLRSSNRAMPQTMAESSAKRRSPWISTNSVNSLSM